MPSRSLKLSNGSSNNTSRPRMKIKPFRTPPALPPNLYQSTVATLLTATRAILRHEPALKPSPSSPLGTASTSVAGAPAAPSCVVPPSSPKSTADRDLLLEKKLISREELYRAVENLCVHGHGAKLYRDVTAVLDEGAAECLRRLNAAGVPGVRRVDAAGTGGGGGGMGEVVFFEGWPDADSAVMILTAVKKVYEDFVDYLGFVRSIFLYLDRSFVLLQSQQRESRVGRAGGDLSSKGGSKASLWDAGIDFFKKRAVAGRDELNSRYSVADVTVHCILLQIQRERDGEAVDRDLLRSNIRIMCELPTLYSQNFLPQFLKHSVEYFDREGRKWMEDNPNALAPFCHHVQKRLDQAHDMGISYLPSSKEPVLVNVVEEHLLLPHVDGFLLQPRNLHPLLTIENISPKTMQDLNLLYSHLRRIQRLDALRGAYLSHAKQMGKDIIHTNSTENAKDIIPELLKFKMHLEMLTKEAFANQEIFLTSLKGILEDVLNESEKTGRLVAELLAKHVDGRLRSNKIGNNDEVESFLNDALSLFRHLSSKDVFEAFYKRDLAKRLLLQKSASIDFEKSFLSKLKTECGTGYTAKMEGMFKDMELSRDTMASFGATNIKDGLTGKMDVPIGKMDVHILTTGYWPVYQQLKNIKLPNSMTNYIAAFEHYYAGKYQGRRIAWQHSLGTCHIKSNFPKGTKELVLSQYQAIVLLLCFNDTSKDAWTISEIIEKTGIDNRTECDMVLLSLSCGRDGTRVLTKLNPDKKKNKNRKVVEDDDIFRFNSRFESRQHRIQIRQIQMKETAEERDKTHEAVSRDRLYLVDAAVVRIMKARKTIDHQTLLGEVMNQVKFPCSGSDVKKRIESLIEREYMERDANSVSRYNYLA